MKLKVVTLADHPNHPGFRQLQRSLEFFGYDYHVIDTPWRGFGTKIIETAKYVRTIQDEYTHFLFVDAHDTFFLAGPDELERKAPDHILIVNAEKACWPDADRAKDYAAFRFTQWCYVNSGVYLSPISVFLEFVDLRPIAYTDDDQRWMTDIYLSLEKGMDVDEHCISFQSIAFQAPGEFAIENGRIRNLITNTTPIVIHGNGRTPMDWVYQLLP